MHFLYPAILWGLVALSIPIIIHLFKFKRVKKIFFSQTAFLREIKEQNKSKQQLKRWLILFSRLAFILFLVLTFAQPYLGKSDSKFSQLVSIYLDNSYSSFNEVEEGRNGLEASISAVNNIINTYPRGTKFKLLTNEFSPEQTYYYTGEVIKDKLTEITSTPVNRDWTEVTSRLTNNGSEEENSKSIVVSDFQYSENRDLSLIEIDKIDELIRIPYPETSNLSIDTVYLSEPFVLPGEQNSLIFRVRNWGNTTAATQVKVSLDNKLLSTQSLDVPAQGTIVSQVPINGSFSTVVSGNVQLTDYPLTYDNQLFFSLRPAAAIKILELYSPGDTPQFDAVYGNTKLFSYRGKAADNLNYTELAWADLIILNRLPQVDLPLLSRIREVNLGGKSLIYIPPANINKVDNLTYLGVNASEVNSTGQQKLAPPDRSNPIFKGIFADDKAFTMPQAKPVIRLPNTLSAVYTLQSGLSYLATANEIWVFASPITDEFTSLHRHALFLPTMYKIAFSSLQAENPIYYTTDQRNLVVPYSSSTEKFLKLENGNSELVPVQQAYDSRMLLTIPAENLEAGFYNVYSGDSLQGVLAFNLPQNESNPKFTSAEELTEMFAENEDIKISSVLDYQSPTQLQANSGITFLWKWTLLLALLCLLTEVLLIRFLK
jgi:hypothetical protein